MVWKHPVAAEPPFGVESRLPCDELREEPPPHRAAVLLRGAGVEEQRARRAHHSGCLPKERWQVEVVQGVERQERVKLSRREREVLGEADHTLQRRHIE
jgi:hypothetical protein